MRCAVLSDIHGNIVALKEVCEKCIKNGITNFVFLGDYVTDIPASHDVIEYIRQLSKKYNVKAVRGNRDAAIMQYDEAPNGDWNLSQTSGDFLLSYNDMTREDIDFLSSMPENDILELPNGEKVLLTHAFPLSKEAREIKDKNGITKILFGHAHYQGIWRDETGLKYVNPGAVFLSDDGKPEAEYAVIEADEESRFLVDLKVANYDKQMVIAMIQNNPLLTQGCQEYGKTLIASLSSGRNVANWYIKELVRLKEVYKNTVEAIKKLGLTDDDMKLELNERLKGYTQPSPEGRESWRKAKASTMVGPNKEMLHGLEPHLIFDDDYGIEMITEVDALGTKQEGRNHKPVSRVIDAKLSHSIEKKALENVMIYLTREGSISKHISKDKEI